MKDDACAYDTRNVGVGRAGPEFAAAALSIAREAAAWSAARGIEVWKDAELREDDFLTAAECGQLVVGFDGPQAVATMLLQHTDPLYWPQVAAGTSLFLHKIAVRRAAAGKGWLTRLVRFAVDAAHAQGIGWLRLDTLFQSRLQGVYQHQGFRLVVEEPLTVNGRRMIRMERALCP